MQELIKIEKRVIGAEETNSVNARELHEALEIKKDFTNWIKTQISRAGLRKDVDYIIVSQKVQAGNGVSTKKDYIITTDSSKHIAMMSQGQKAKEVRDYFIAVEKEFRTGATQNINIQELVKATVSEMLAAQKPTALTPEQLGKIRGAVSMAAEAVFTVFENDEQSRIQQVIYKKLNNMLGTPSYIYIPADAFDEAMAIINDIQRKHEQRYKEIQQEKKEMLASINNDDYTFTMPDFL